jgi:polyribonucleotide nucleotidyltransferase
MSEKITIKALADAIEEIREELKLFKQEITKFSISNQSIEKPIKKVVIIPDEPITIKAKKDE